MRLSDIEFVDQRTLTLAIDVALLLEQSELHAGTWLGREKGSGSTRKRGEEKVRKKEKGSRKRGQAQQKPLPLTSALSP